MITVDKCTEIKSVEEIKQEIDEFNSGVEAYNAAIKWLKEATKNKMNSKATKAILPKWETEYRSGYEATGSLGNGYGWSITMGDSGYHTPGREKCINIKACKEEKYSNGKPVLVEIENFYCGKTTYAKGATWAEVHGEIERFVKPQKKTYTMQELQEWHDIAQAAVDKIREIENYDDQVYKERGFYPVSKFIKEH